MIKGLSDNPIFKPQRYKLKCHAVMADPVNKTAMGIFLAMHGHGFLLIFQEQQEDVVICPFNDDMDLYLLFHNDLTTQVTIVNKEVEVIRDDDDEFVTNVFSYKRTQFKNEFSLDDSIKVMNHNNLVDLAKKVFGKNVLFG